MFEQSILVRQQTSKPWSVALSLAAELAGIGLLIVLPLVWTQNLPGLTTKIGVWLAPTHQDPPSQPAHPGPRRFVRPSPFGLSYVPHDLPAKPVPITDTLPPDIGGPVGASATPIPGMLLSQFSDSGLRPPAPPLVKRTVHATPAPPIIVRISHLDPAKLLVKVIPRYPEMAKRIRIQGTVHLEGVIATDGTIQSLQVISGHPFLVQAAVEAVRQWRYQPTVLNGQAVEVMAPIDVTFTLQ